MIRPEEEKQKFLANDKDRATEKVENGLEAVKRGLNDALLALQEKGEASGKSKIYKIGEIPYRLDEKKTAWLPYEGVEVRFVGAFGVLAESSVLKRGSVAVQIRYPKSETMPGGYRHTSFSVNGTFSANGSVSSAEMYRGKGNKKIIKPKEQIGAAALIADIAVPATSPEPPSQSTPVIGRRT